MNIKQRFIVVVLLVLVLVSAGPAAAGSAGGSAPALGGPAAISQGQFVIPLGQDTVTVDGFCNTDLEYSDAASAVFADYGGSGRIYFKHTATDLYVCVIGTVGPNRDRFFRVYLDRDNGREAWAEPDDLGLQVDIATGLLGVVQGTGSGGYTSASAIGWTAVATTDNYDAAEYRISVRLTNGWCENSFGLAVYHHWMTAPGDDYGWPSNQWYDQPQTWTEAVLSGAPCQVPVYRLHAPPVDPDTALQLASLLEGLGGQSALTDTTHARTPRFSVANEARGAALQQLAASGGFFAFNANEAFSPQPRGPFDPTNARLMACNFLMWNELFPWEQTPSEAMDCSHPTSLPYEVNTINLAEQMPGAAAGPAQVSQAAVVVHVPLGVNIGGPDSSQYIPMTGPGGHLSLLFTSTDPQGNAWSLDGDVPGLAALAEPWHDRTLTLMDNFPIIGRDEAIQQVQARFPGRPLNPGQPELAFYVGDPAVPQSVLLPVWTFPDAWFDDGGQPISPRTMVIPAVPGLLPDVVITSPPDGTVFTPGQAVALNGTIGGGSGPYTYTWSLEDGTVLGSGVSAGGAVALTTSALPAVNHAGQAVDIWVFLDAVDGNGIQAGDAVSLRPAYVPAVFLPIVVRGFSGPGLRAAAFPAAGVQATYRVGVEWVALYNGMGADLPGVPPDGNGFYNALKDYGWSHGVKWTNNAAWERDWRDCSLGGSDCSYGMDRAEFAYFSGHGSPARIYFGTTHDAGNFWGGNARFQTIKWAAFSSCQTMRDSSIGDWFNAFQGGARVLLGFQSNMADIAFGAPLVDNMRVPTFLGFVEMPWLQRTIPQAWVQTAFQMNAGRPAYLYVTGHGVDTSLDKLPKNGGPALPSPYPIEWYHWVWWD